jgi:Uma2 family endonuclease
MVTIPNRLRLKFDDYCVLVNDQRTGDLIDGVFYVTAPDLLPINEMTTWLLGCLNSYVKNRDLGSVFFMKVAVRFDDHNATQPDLCFIAKRRSRIIRREFVAGSPDLIIEVVSPDTLDRDYKLKRKLYERKGVGEYWMVDPVFERITLLRLDRNGQYRKARAKHGVLRSDVVPGFRLRTEWLWHEPRPCNLDVAAELIPELKDRYPTLFRIGR